MSSTFEPDTVIAILKNSVAVPAKEKKEFDKKWQKSVNSRLEGWLKNRGSGTEQNLGLVAQLEWEAHVVEYVGVVYKLTKCHGNAKKDTIPPNLPKDVPFLGPRFLPPTHLHLRKRQHAPLIQPKPAYLKPLNVVHPLYHDNIAKCPKCGTKDIRWDCWTPSGHRNLHGVCEEETAIGYQLICKECESKFSHAKGKEGADKGMFCFATTNPVFWEKWEHWEIPRDIPYFLKCCAVTHELFDLIIELRPSLTSMGLAENIKQLHLLTYKRKMLEYLQNLQFRKVSPFRPDPLTAFSDPLNSNGYHDCPITSDLITDIFIKFSDQTRKAESETYLQTLSAKCLSLDNTFKSAGKATVVDKQKTRVKLMKGGILNVLNERAEIVGWRFCLSASPDEITEFLNGYIQRCQTLGVMLPEMVVIDNCCQMRNAITKAMPDIHVILDVYHFLRRYMIVIINGAKNPHRSEVAKDISQSIIKTKATKGSLATYWSREEQIENMERAFEKWAKKGDVWSIAASKVHAEQMRHVRRGCLARTRDDIATDGTRIEASHKGWNSLQRSFASGLEVFRALVHDFVLQRNICIAFARKDATPFMKSTHGSHHIRLTHHIAVLWNQVLKNEKKRTDLQSLPEMLIVDSHEAFGLTGSQHVETFGGFLDDSDDSEDLDFQLVSESFDEFGAELDFLQNLNIEPALRAIPLEADDTTVKLHSTFNGHGNNNQTKEMNADVLSLITDRADIVIDPGASKTSEPSCTGHSTITTISKRKADPKESTVNKRSRTGEVTIVSLNDYFKTRQGPAVETFLAMAPGSLVDQLSKRLELPDSRALTRSQHLFSIETHIDVRSLSIAGDDEFFLFMRMRVDYQWVSFSMTPKRWVVATHDFNVQLELLNTEKGRSITIKKNPRALLDKLGEVEQIITTRISTGKYTSKRSNTDTFWRHHCHAVPLVKTENVNTGSAAIVKTRKPATCTRCLTIMYPGLSGAAENHRRNYCSDGVRASMKNEGDPQWPQPPGIFENGELFNPITFLNTLREVYEEIVVRGGDGGDLIMEYEAFIKMLHARMFVTANGHHLFKLFDNLNMPFSTPNELVVELEGSRYLRMDCLHDDDGDAGLLHGGLA